MRLELDDALSNHGGTVSDAGRAFLTWENQWTSFYFNTFGGVVADTVAAFNDGNRDQLVQFEERFAALADKLAAEGVDVPDSVAPRAEGSGSLFGNNLLPNLTDSLQAAVLLLIVFAIVWKVVV